MSFGSPATPTINYSAVPTPPANPPMFGTQASKGSASQMTPTSTWVGSVLGAAAQPQQQKTLLGS